MQRALSSSDVKQPPVKPQSTAEMSPSSVTQKITVSSKVESLKKQVLESDSVPKVDTTLPEASQKKGVSPTGSPQRIQPTAEAQSAKAAKGPETDKRPIQTSDQEAPMNIQKISGSQAPTSGLKKGSDASKTTESMTGKMFGFGSSIFSSASTLISSAVQEESRTTPPGSRKMSAPVQVSPKMSAVPKISPKTTTDSTNILPEREPKTPAQKPDQEKIPDASLQSKQDTAPSQPPKEATTSQVHPTAGQENCPLCNIKLNIGSKDPVNYNVCTDCKATVCTQCGFNPIPVGEVSACEHKYIYCFLYTVCTYTLFPDSAFESIFLL